MISLASSALSLSASAIELANAVQDNTPKEKTQVIENRRDFVPVWYECADTMVDLTQVVSITSWHYLVKSHIPRGIRFKLTNGKVVDTKEMSSSEVELRLESAKRHLKECSFVRF